MTQIKSLDELKDLAIAVFMYDNVRKNHIENWVFMEGINKGQLLEYHYGNHELFKLKNWHYHPDNNNDDTKSKAELKEPKANSMDYRIIKGTTLDSLQRQVQEFMEHGFVLAGGISSPSEDFFIQAVAFKLSKVAKDDN